MLWNEAVTKGTGVDHTVGKVSSMTKVVVTGTVRGAVVRDLIADRGIESGTAHLTWTADGYVRLRDCKHTSCQCVSEGHWEDV